MIDKNIRPCAKLKMGSFSWEEFEKIKMESLQKEQEKRITERTNSQLDKVPMRYKNKSLSDFKVLQTEQATVKAIVEGYILTFLERKSEGACIVFVGRPGTGKTMLSLIIYQALAVKGYSVRYESSLQFLKSLQEKKFESSGAYQTILNLYCEVDFLILDEVSESVTKDGSPSEWEKKLLFDLINARYEKGNRCTLIISNRDKAELNFRIGSQVMDRLLDKGFVLGFNWNSFRT
jgi:DNA replication protein DnaC